MTAATLLSATIFAGLASALPQPQQGGRVYDDPNLNFYYPPKCEPDDAAVLGDYTLYNTVYDRNSPSSSQCVSWLNIPLDDGLIAWNATWTYSSSDTTEPSPQGSGFPNVVYRPVQNSPRKLSDIASMPTNFTWIYDHGEGDAPPAHVGYDFWTSSQAKEGQNENEIQIWLSSFSEVQPVSESRSENGTSLPVDTFTLKDGTEVAFYQGKYGAIRDGTPIQVFTFIPTAKKLDEFHGDIQEFFSHLTAKIPDMADQFLVSASAGIQVYGGSQMTFTASRYSLGW